MTFGILASSYVQAAAGPATFIASTSSASSAGPSLPGGIATGDLLVYIVVCDEVDSPSVGAEWSTVGSAVSSGADFGRDSRLTVYSTVYDSGSPPSTAITGINNFTVNGILAFEASATVADSAFGSSATNANSENVTAPTTSNTSTVVIAASYGDNQSITIASDTLTLSSAIAQQTAAGTDGALYASHGNQASAGSAGTTTLSSVPSMRRAYCHLIITA